MTFRLRRAALALLLILGPILSLAPAAASAGAASPEPGRPGELVAGLNETLLEVMRNAQDLGFQGRYERLAPVLNETFNFRVMAGISAGRHWRALSPEQRTQLVEAFARMSIGTFAKRFDGYGGERFEVAGEEDGPRESVLVRNKLVKSDGEAVEINYLMKRYDERWRAVDVYLDSKFSELAIKRSEYSSVIENEGLDNLLRRIEDKLATWAAEG